MLGYDASPLCRERGAHRRDNAVLRALVEISVHGQADHLPRQALAHRCPALGNGKVPVRLLAVHRVAVVDRGGDALALSELASAVAPRRRYADGVLRPNG